MCHKGVRLFISENCTSGSHNFNRAFISNREIGDTIRRIIVIYRPLPQSFINTFSLTLSKRFFVVHSSLIFSRASRTTFERKVWSACLVGYGLRPVTLVRFVRPGSSYAIVLFNNSYLRFFIALFWDKYNHTRSQIPSTLRSVRGAGRTVAQRTL